MKSRPVDDAAGDVRNRRRELGERRMIGGIALVHKRP